MKKAYILIAITLVFSLSSCFNSRDEGGVDVDTTKVMDNGAQEKSSESTEKMSDDMMMDHDMDSDDMMKDESGEMMHDEMMVEEWVASEDGTWQDASGNWLKIGDGKLWWTSDGENWSEVPNWSWEGANGVWYKFDSEWKLWSSTDGENWSEVEGGSWEGKDGMWYKLDTEAKLWWKKSMMMDDMSVDTMVKESSDEMMDDKMMDEEMKMNDDMVSDMSTNKEFLMESYGNMVDGEYQPRFSLSEIRVKKGDNVTIKVTNTAGRHDITIDEYGISEETPLNEEVSVEFVADKVGEFIYYCSKPGHREKGQWGTLIVEE